jgi:anti-anti-sigma factor
VSELCTVDVITREGVRVARLRGEIDLSNADSTYAALEDAFADHPEGLVLDLSELDYVDSAGVRLLFKLAQAGSEKADCLRAVVPRTAPIRRVLELAHVQHALALDETADAAIESLHRDKT